MTDPATREKLWEVPIGSQQDVDEAVVSAQKAFESWSEVPFEKRKEMLAKYKDHYMQHSDDMTTLLCQETGKPKQFAEFETKVSRAESMILMKCEGCGVECWLTELIAGRGDVLRSSSQPDSARGAGGG